MAAGLLQATSLPFIVTASQIGVPPARMSSTTAAAMVCAGLVSVMVFPVIALAQLRDAGAGRGRYAAAVFRCPTSTTPSTTLTS